MSADSLLEQSAQSAESKSIPESAEALLAMDVQGSSLLLLNSSKPRA